MSEEEDAIEEIYEPYLMQLGLLDRTQRGRVLPRSPTNISAWKSRAASSLFSSSEIPHGRPHRLSLARLKFGDRHAQIEDCASRAWKRSACAS